MFVHDGLLEPALAPAHYTSAAFFEAEVRALFRRGWHPVATHAQLATEGAYVASDIAGLPVIVRRERGTLHAFVNVCAHRQSLLELPGCGVRDALRCRYHGWEFDAQGALKKLPDGRSFRGIKASGFTLRKLRVDSLGPVVYVGFEPDGPTLANWLGELGTELQPFYERPLKPVWIRVSEHDANWKIAVENAVESYHVPRVHPDTFRYYRDPALHDHRIEPTFTRYADLEPWATSATGRALSLFAKLALEHSDGLRFRHAHRFPNQLYYYGDLFSEVSVVTPIDAKRCRYQTFGFVADELRLRRLMAPVLRTFGALLNRQSKRIFAEDLSVWSAVQAGVEHAERAGALSAREERVWAFQRWVASQAETTDSSELVTLQGPRSAAPARSKER